MVLFLWRDKLSYFQSYKIYFIAIYLVFLGFPSADLVISSISQPVFLRLATQVFVTSGTSIAVIWGYVATKLYMYPKDTLSLKRLISRPFRRIFLLYAAYLAPMALASLLAWLDTSEISTSPSSQVAYVLDGVRLPSASVASTLLGLGAVIVVVFASYPLAILSKRSALVADRDVRAALRIIASVFGIISATLILGIGLSSFGYSIMGLTDFLSVVLIMVAVRAFRKPSFLKSFLGVVPSLQSSLASRFDQVILIHGPGDEKFAPIAKYVIDGVNQKERVIYFHSGDVDGVTEGLSREGVDVTRLMLKGSMRISPLRSAYPSSVRIDDTPLELVKELAAEARTLGSEGLRVVLDYDDFVVRPVQKFAQQLTDPRWTSPDHRLHVLMAFDSMAFKGEEASLAELESKVRTLDLSEARDTFSQTVGLSHEDVAGRKLLFEYDPQWDYKRVFKSLLAETASNFERTVAFTRKDSALYALLKQQPAAKIFVLTSRVSYPKMESENLFLLPTYDTSLFLDALNKTIDAYAGSSFTIICDNISHFIFTLGPERTYSLIRQSLELMISDKITAVFSMNSKAHDQKVMSTFENMFDFELAGELGSTVPHIRKKTIVTS